MKLLIKSKGIIDTNLLKIIGFSTKRDDNTKFGQFGSGVKYAIALLLRNDIGFDLYNGLEKVDIGVESQELYSNGEIYHTNTIAINGVNTNISVDIGPDWELWMVLRELISNAKDQGESMHKFMNDGFIPEEGYLQWVIDGSNAVKFAQIIEGMSFVYRDTWDFVGKQGIKYKRASGPAKVYYQGFYAGKLSDQKAMFDIDATNYIQIDERRVYKHLAPYLYFESLFGLTDKELIREYIKRFSNTNTYEFSKFSSIVDTTYISKEFKEVLNEMHIAPINMQTMEDMLKGDIKYDYVPLSFYAAVKPYIQSNIKDIDGKIYKETLDELVDINLRNLVDTCQDIVASWFPNVHKYPIVYAEIMSEENAITYGLADSKNKSIIINKSIESRPENMNKEFLVGLILEEFIHLEFSVRDYTRDFQNILLFNLSKSLILNHDVQV